MLGDVTGCFRAGRSWASEIALSLGPAQGTHESQLLVMPTRPLLLPRVVVALLPPQVSRTKQRCQS